MPTKLSVPVLMMMIAMATPATAHFTAETAHNGGHGWLIAAAAAILISAGLAFFRSRS